jgi:hypothetical protein
MIVMDFAGIKSPILRGLLEVWRNSRHPGELLPAKRWIDPVKLARVGAMPILWLVQREESGAWRYRLCGERINAIHGRSLSGKCLSEVADPARVQEITERWNRCVDENLVLRTYGHIYGAAGRHTGERIVLPVRGNASGQFFILGGTDGALEHQSESATRPRRGHLNVESAFLKIEPREPSDNS